MLSLADDLRRRLADALRPVAELPPDVWGALNREYPPGAGRPGRRDPEITPYTIAFGRSAASRKFRRVVAVFSAQSGKSETLIDLIGARLAQKPAPILYCGPSRQFCEQQFSPRISELLDQAPTLRDKVVRGKRMTKTRMVINGAPLRLAHAGSSTALKSDPAALALVDEVDELLAGVRGQGSPLGLIEARGTADATFVMAMVSTPSEGEIETETDPASGLTFWKRADPKAVASAIWRSFDQGTSRHFAWPCPECGVYFIPRFECVEWPSKIESTDADGVIVTRKLTPAEIELAAFMRCPNCKAEIRDDPDGADLKAEMNRRGVYVCPGQRVEPDGTVVGEVAPNRTDSFWASGLCSPFRTWGERAANYVEAARSGDPEQLRAVVNSALAECFSPRLGDAPAWAEVAAHRGQYRSGDCPELVKIITCGADVQRDRIVFVVRGWGVRQESWLLDHGEVWGDTATDQPWSDFAEQALDQTWGPAGLMVRRCFVDSGFRPGGSDAPTNAVYSFARRHQRVVTACKGFATRQTPVSFGRIEVAAGGGVAAFGLQLARLDSDFLKSWVHDKVRAPLGAPGSWHLPADIAEDFCRQIVSEARTRSVSGAHTWVRLSKQNHYLDCEAMAYGAAWAIGVQRIQDRPARTERTGRRVGDLFGSLQGDTAEAPRVIKPNSPEPPRRPRLSDIGRASNEPDWGF